MAAENAIAKFEESKAKLAKSKTFAQRCLEVAEATEVVTDDDYKQAGERIKVTADRRRLLEAFRDEVCVPIHRAHKAALAEFKPGIDTFKKTEAVLNKKMNDWDAKKAAEEKARQEQLRLAAEAEREEERKQLEAQAKEAEAKGDHEAAEELREEAAEPPLPVPMITSQTPTVEGLRGATRWKFEITDIDKVPMEWCEKKVIGDKVRAEAKRTKGKCQIPGIKVYPDRTRY